jgi:hypothetical protein
MAKPKPITNLNMQAPTRQNAEQIVQARLAEMYEWSHFVDSPYAIRELHNLRIAAKRVRYTLTVFSNFLPGDCKILEKELTQIQDELGVLHDSDVLIALLRLCLGSQENPIADPTVLTGQKGKQPKAKSFIHPELLTAVLDPSVAPTPQERNGLEQFLREQEQKRQQHYQAFRQHWYRLQEQDFRRYFLSIIEQEPVMA